MNGYITKGFCFLILCLCLNTTVFAARIPTTKPYFDGAYVGLGAGLASTTPKLSADNQINVQSGMVNLSGNYNNDNYSEYSFNGQIFTGYGKTFNNSYYIGGEIWGNYFNTKMNHSYNYSIGPMTPGASNDANGHFKVENPYSFGGALRLGYLLSPRVMFYGLIGFDYAKFDVKNTMSDHYVDADIDHNFTITDKFNKWLPAILAGVGGDMGITDHLSLRLQYTFAFYDSCDHSAMKEGEVSQKGNPNFRYPYKINMHTKLDPTRGTLQLMLSYLFN